MTHDDTRTLLVRLGVIYGRSVKGDIVTEWARLLADVERRDAFDALDEIMSNGESGPNLPRLMLAVREIVKRRHPTPSPGYHSIAEPEQHEHTDAEYAAIGQAAIVRIRAEVAERARARAHQHADQAITGRELGLHVVSPARALDMLDPDVEPF